LEELKPKLAKTPRTAAVAENSLPNSIDTSGQNPLHLAADQGCVDIEKSLILNGADIHILDND
jgi:ankyrin repeat protein